MEVEIKLRLPTKEEYLKVKALLGEPKETQHQANYYLDTVNLSLEKLRNIVRVRDINNGEKYILTWKGKATLADGISKVREEETELTKEIGQEILRDPSRIAKYSGEYPLIKHIFSVIGAAATPETAWKVVGEFKTLRLKIPWTSETVELDETTYPFGTGWEIEIETTNPEQVKKQMESLLNENGIAFTESKRNKFLNLINGTII